MLPRASESSGSVICACLAAATTGLTVGASAAYFRPWVRHIGGVPILDRSYPVRSIVSFGGFAKMTEEFSTAREAYRPLDQIDTVLLATLQEQGRLRLEDLARLVKLSPSTVHDRLRRLQRDGVIRKWTIAVNPQALNLTVLAFVGVRASRPCSELVEALGRIHEVEEVHSVDGQLSLVLKVRATSTEHLLHLIEQLKRIPGIESTETTVALKTYIERGPRPVPEERV